MGKYSQKYKSVLYYHKIYSFDTKMSLLINYSEKIYTRRLLIYCIFYNYCKLEHMIEKNLHKKLKPSSYL